MYKNRFIIDRSANNIYIYAIIIHFKNILKLIVLLPRGVVSQNGTFT